MGAERYRNAEPGWVSGMGEDGWMPGGVPGGTGMPPGVRTPYGEWSGGGGYGRRASAVGQVWRALGWEETREDVMRESQGRVALVGVRGAGKRRLLAQLRGWEATGGEPESLPAVEDQGFWRVVDLPAGPAVNGEWGAGSYEAWEQTRAADLVLLVTTADELNGEALRWAARIRAAGQPMLAVLVGPAATEFGRAVLVQRVGPQVVLLPDGVRAQLEGLLKAVMAASPALVVPLGRELPGWRRWLAERLISQTSLTCGFWGLEPVPLMDLPMQVAAQTGLALRLLAMYGCASPSPARREALLLVASGLLLRLVVVQVLKVVPVAGWLLAGVMSAIGTWALGWLLVVSLEQADDGAPWSLLRRAGVALALALEARGWTVPWVGQLLGVESGKQQGESEEVEEETEGEVQETMGGESLAVAGEDRSIPQGLAAEMMVAEGYGTVVGWAVAEGALYGDDEVPWWGDDPDGGREGQAAVVILDAEAGRQAAGGAEGAGRVGNGSVSEEEGGDLLWWEGALLGEGPGVVGGAGSGGQPQAGPGGDSELLRVRVEAVGDGDALSAPPGGAQVGEEDWVDSGGVAVVCGGDDAVNRGEAGAIVVPNGDSVMVGERGNMEGLGAMRQLSFDEVGAAGIEDETVPLWGAKGVPIWGPSGRKGSDES